MKGKAILITGGARRLGREMALHFARLGADVAVTYRTSQEEGIQTAREISSLGVHGFTAPLDVRDERSVRRCLDEVHEAFGHLDVLVNNAANYETVDMEEMSVEQWDSMFAANTRGPFLISRNALDMLRQREGRIIHIGSLGGLRPWASHAHYCASKAALHMLTKVMAKAFAPQVAVNCVAPGKIDMGEAAQDNVRQHFAEKTPMKRNGTPADVAPAVEFFATCPSFITGQVLAVDGGLELV